MTAYSVEGQRVKWRCREEHQTQLWSRSQGLEKTLKAGHFELSVRKWHVSVD